MNEKINLTKQDGSVVNGDIICFIENVDSKKRYVYYTLNEMAGDAANSTVKIYVTKVSQNDATLDAPITKEEWDQLKGYMSDALKSNTNPSLKYLPLTELVNPVSVSEMAIAMPTSYDYINKQRGIYAQSIATMEPEKAPEAVVEPTPIVPDVPTESVVEPAPIETPIVEPTEITPESPVVTPAVEPTPNAQEQNSSLNNVEEKSTVEETNSVVPEPIDIQEIEAKYTKMIEDINKLKEQEIEAVNRYNATIKLSSMHNEQHASYVQNEQSKSNEAVEPASVTPIEPVVVDESTELVEPVALEPVVPEPVPSTNEASLETNWFDMPANN